MTHLIIILIVIWYFVGYNLTYDFIVPGAMGYNRWWKNWLALFICATLWPLIASQIVIHYGRLFWEWLWKK